MASLSPAEIRAANAAPRRAALTAAWRPAPAGIAVDDDEIYYPESDGKPMADNMTQHRWMTFIHENLTLLFKDDPQVLVASDLLWYPLKGRSEINSAPDVMVVFGRPGFERRSYKQWEEAGIAPQVVFEILSDSNTVPEMLDKVAFFQRNGVEECYIYDPETGGLDAVLYNDGRANLFPVVEEWTSPRIGVRFVPQPRADMEIYFPDGRPFVSIKELDAVLEYTKQQLETTREQRDAERMAREEAQKARGEAEAKAELLAARLRELGIDPTDL